ncbi:MAG: hypothetical protein RSC34_00420, partial [Alistipes sp.]
RTSSRKDFGIVPPTPSTLKILQQRHITTVGIGKIFDMQTNKIYEFGSEVGKTSMELYTRLQDIQYGRAEDKHNWCTIVL